MAFFHGNSGLSSVIVHAFSIHYKTVVLIMESRSCGSTVYGCCMICTCCMYGWCPPEIDTSRLTAIDNSTLYRYYENGHTALLPDFFTVTVLDKLIGECKTAFGAVQKYQPGIELWLGETSSCYGGGAPHLSNTYVAGFM